MSAAPMGSDIPPSFSLGRFIANATTIRRLSMTTTDGRRNTMTPLNPRYTDMQRAIRHALGAHWRLFLFQGAIMIILGALAFAAPAAATIAVDIYLGWLFLISGIVGLVAMFSAKDIPAFLWSLVTAAFSVSVGVLLVWKPVESALSLTIVLTAFFVVESAFQIVTSIAYRDLVGGCWGVVVASGISGLALAAFHVLG